MNYRRLAVAMIVGGASAALGFRFFPSSVGREKALAASLAGVAGFEATRLVQSFIPEN